MRVLTLVAVAVKLAVVPVATFVTWTVVFPPLGVWFAVNTVSPLADMARALTEVLLPPTFDGAAAVLARVV